MAVRGRGTGRDQERDRDLDRDRDRDPGRRAGRGRGVIALAVFLAVLLGAGVSVSLPIRSILDQQRRADARQAELERVQTEIRRLDARLAQLNDPDVIAQLSREKYGYVLPGWESYHLVTPEIGDVQLPDGWPFVLLAG